MFSSSTIKIPPHISGFFGGVGVSVVVDVVGVSVVVVVEGVGVSVVVVVEGVGVSVVVVVEGVGVGVLVVVVVVEEVRVGVPILHSGTTIFGQTQIDSLGS
jgi:hypothetical protein